VLLKPLSQWICDRCNKVIESPSAGWIEWLSDENNKNSGFKIVHHASFSPRGPSADCYHYSHTAQRHDMCNAPL
jgi:Fe2+ or Zn2+ uptake regulation protein